MTVGVFGGHKTRKTIRRVHMIVFLERTNKPTEIEALEVEAICSGQILIPDEEDKKKTKETGLNTPAFTLDEDNGNSVVILIGSDYNWQFVTVDVKTVWKKWKELKAVHTKLGWAVKGPLPFSGNTVHCFSTIVL